MGTLKELKTRTDESRKGFAGREPLTDIARTRDAKVLFVFCDQHYEQSAGLIADMGDALGAPSPASMNLSKLLSSKDLKGDMLIINSLSPNTIFESSDALESAIKLFRDNNPGCAVVIVNLYGKSTPAGALIHDLERAGLASVLDGPAGYQQMIAAGAEELAKNAL